jgi:hypothetical protein
MVLLLNLIPFLICAGWCLWAAKSWNKSKQPKTVIIFIVGLTLSLLLYKNVQPSYLPKGEIARTEVVQEEVVSQPIEDKLLKPMSPQERDARRKEQYKEKIEFINQKEVDNK